MVRFAATAADHGRDVDGSSLPKADISVTKNKDGKWDAVCIQAQMVAGAPPYAGSDLSSNQNVVMVSRAKAVRLSKLAPSTCKL